MILQKAEQEFYMNTQEFDNKYAVVCKGCNQEPNVRLGLPENNKYFIREITDV